MKRDFVNLQDRCRATIVRRLRRKSDLDKLKVPPRIRNYLYEGMVDNVQPIVQNKSRIQILNL